VVQAERSPRQGRGQVRRAGAHVLVLDLEELEACGALHKTRHVTLPLVGGWQQSPYREASFRSYPSSRYGSQNIGSSAGLRTALASSTKIMQEKLGLAPGVSPGV